MFVWVVCGFAFCFALVLCWFFFPREALAKALSDDNSFAESAQNGEINWK